MSFGVGGSGGANADAIRWGGAGVGQPDRLCLRFAGPIYPRVLRHPRRDGITGRNAEDIIFAMGGDDYVKAYSGNDEVRGGAHTDHIQGGAHDEELYGGDGADYDVL
jgi:Ca2+-binding RTX toxin-like protein